MIFEEITYCRFHPSARATQDLADKGSPVPVCTPCFEKMLEASYICKYCRVRVVSEEDTRAIPGRSHKTVCPRAWNPKSKEAS